MPRSGGIAIARGRGPIQGSRPSCVPLGCFVIERRETGVPRPMPRGRFGFSWRLALSPRNPRPELLDFLGFPWILSSEMSVFNGLRGIFARIISCPLPPASCGVATGAAFSPCGSPRLLHGTKLSPPSGFPQEIVDSYGNPVVFRLSPEPLSQDMTKNRNIGRRRGQQRAVAIKREILRPAVGPPQFKKRRIPSPKGAWDGQPNIRPSPRAHADPPNGSLSKTVRIRTR